jgi:hypothetical protein
VTKTGVQVSAGTFTVQLDFGASAFPGPARFLDIGVKRPADSSFTPLSPRQPITSTPYAVRSLSAETIFIGSERVLNVTGTVAFPNSNTFVGVGAGINNTPGSPGSTSGSFNSFFGERAGSRNTDGNLNSFFGAVAGFANTKGFSNSFFGVNAGFNNTLGDGNSSIGTGAGGNNTEGNFNSFLGESAGTSNTTENNNTFLGARSNGEPGITNSTAVGFRAKVTRSDSLVLGSINGVNAATADTNVGIGTTAPAYKLEVVDSSNTGLRVQTNVPGGTVASFGSSGAFEIDEPFRPGARFQVSEDGNVGIGTTRSSFKLAVIDSSNTGLRVQTNATGGTVASFGGNGAFQVDASGTPGGRFAALENGNVGIATNAPLGRLQVVTTDDINPLIVPVWNDRHFVVGGPANSGAIGFSYDQTNNVGYISSLSPNLFWRNLVLQVGGGNVGIGPNAPMDKLHVSGGLVRFDSLAGGGTTSLCQNPFGQISLCSSSVRYKTSITPFGSGLNLVSRLSPITFNWKQGGLKDLGLGAEDVEKVEPLLVTYNDQGEVEGVKYDRVAVVLINAVKEQQKQIEEQRNQIASLQTTNAALNSRLRALEKSFRTRNRLSRRRR